MLAEELVILDADSPLWSGVRALIDRALQLEQHDETYAWHGWSKRTLDAFLKRLPGHCTLLLGVWDDEAAGDSILEHDPLLLGCVCEVIEGEIHTVRGFEALAGLSPVAQLEPGYQDALALMRVTKTQVAPVAWALFTDKTTWYEWLFADGEDGHAIEKGELLTALAEQGRCVLMGSQTLHHT